MPALVVIGSQWGDEGKGKVVDVFSSQSDYVVRYQGGSNAGHTLIVDGKKTVLHLVPSGVLHPETKCIIATGVVLDIETLVQEIKALKANGLLKDSKQLLISDTATVLLSYHRKLDQARELDAKNEKIGTTGKGIGPAYEDRASRKAILFGDLFSPDTLKDKLKKSLDEKNFLLEHKYKQDPVELNSLLEDIKVWTEELRPYRCLNAPYEIHQALKADKKVLFEGAQGTLLDLLHGTYPFVTSSSTISGSACIGSGIGPNQIQKIVGITKAYTTRVGSGPFPTELDDSVGEHLGKVGKEFGATTGRKRRCGWLDLVALKYAIRINGITNLSLMKIDVLSGLDTIKLCTNYEVSGEKTSIYPVTPGELSRVKPIYKEVPGWSEDISGAKSLQDLPANARSLISLIGAEVGIPIDVVSVGPGRKQTIWIKPLF